MTKFNVHLDIYYSDSSGTQPFLSLNQNQKLAVCSRQFQHLLNTWFKPSSYIV